METFDIAVIGGGPGGYVAAIRAAKAGHSVALVEAQQLGGTCLNRGCVPSKVLLHHAEVIENIKKAETWGIETGRLHLSLDKMMKRKNQVIQKLRLGISALLGANKIKVYDGIGTVQPDLAIEINTNNGLQNIQAKKVMIATGSKPSLVNIPGIDEIVVHTSDTIFDITEIPESVVIIGGGVIAVEFACIFASLDVDVTIIETANRIIPTEDVDASNALHKSLTKKGIHIFTNCTVTSFEKDGMKKGVLFEDSTGEIVKKVFDEVLMAVGRKPNIECVEDLNLEMNGPYIRVNDELKTSHPAIYAIGDVIGGWQLAHVATAEGLIAAENATMRKQEKVDYKAVPRCIYTSPEVATVGYSEYEVEQLGYEVEVKTFPFRNSGKALAMDETDGFIKIIADKKYGEILGVVIVGARATEMISQATSYIYLEGTIEELAQMIHPHPTLAEGMFEVANSLMGQGIHM